jgi:hypothetical protein
MQVKDLSASGAKFKTRAANAAPDYVKGATAAGGRWKAGVDSSADRWAAGVQDAVARQAFSKGVSKTGADYYTSRVAKLGNAALRPGRRGRRGQLDRRVQAVRGRAEQRDALAARHQGQRQQSTAFRRSPDRAPQQENGRGVSRHRFP